ncbi:hypothetical protein RF11_14568 [Thelohanellus kitauei]|uniref:Uncharacterized protein n=1 Tax=Thelohanellus kitauei TaxID=669202 RepID=A0A0C2MQ30_THEKT|nr:hypothetical protein RF11_14568 [Thelohanellus kitauei]
MNIISHNNTLIFNKMNIYRDISRSLNFTLSDLDNQINVLTQIINKNNLTDPYSEKNLEFIGQRYNLTMEYQDHLRNVTETEKIMSELNSEMIRNQEILEILQKQMDAIYNQTHFIENNLP